MKANVEAKIELLLFAALFIMFHAIPGYSAIEPGPHLGSPSPSTAILAQWTDLDLSAPNFDPTADHFAPGTDDPNLYGQYNPPIIRTVDEAEDGSFFRWTIGVTNFTNLPADKRLRLQLQYSAAEEYDMRLFDSAVYGFDADGKQTRSVFNSLWTDGDRVIEWDWQLFDNPVYEEVAFDVPRAVTLQTITIETVAAPIPGAVWLLGSVIVGLGWLTRFGNKIPLCLSRIL